MKTIYLTCTKLYESPKDMPSRSNTVSIEETIEIMNARAAINRLDFRDIIWTKEGKVIEFSEEELDRFEMLGLNNIDFILSK